MVQIRKWKAAAIDTRFGDWMANGLSETDVSYKELTQHFVKLGEKITDQPRELQSPTERAELAQLGLAALDSMALWDNYHAFELTRASTPAQKKLLAAKEHLVAEYYLRFKDTATSGVSRRIGYGRSAISNKIELDDEVFAVRQVVNIPYATVDQHVTAAIRVAQSGLPHLEQVVAVSYATRRTVAKFAPGKPIHDMNTEELAYISPEQIGQLHSAMKTASEEWGILFDMHGDNLLYDPAQGFTAIDLSVEGDYYEEADEALLRLARLLNPRETLGASRVQKMLVETVFAGKKSPAAMLGKLSHKFLSAAAGFIDFQQ